VAWSATIVAPARIPAAARACPRLGLSLEESKVELDTLPTDRVPTGADWDRLTRIWSARIEARSAGLERLKHGLTDCIGRGCLSLGRCALLNPDDRAASLGAGPRYWLGDPRPPG
jgi:MerR family transcriptional regulator, redox-sensitive transcriptional activator SoxR